MGSIKLGPRFFLCGIYSDAEIARLQQILVYRATGMGLDAIGTVLDSPDDALTHLRWQRDVLIRKQHELDAMIHALDQLMEDAMGTNSLGVEDIAQILGNAEFPAWQAEAEKRWGETDEWQDAARQTDMSSGDWDDYTARTQELETCLAQAMRSGVEPGSAEANALVDEHRTLLSHFFPVTHARHVLIARNYVNDPRFAEHFDAQAPGLSAWLKAAIDACAEAYGIDPDAAQWN